MHFFEKKKKEKRKARLFPMLPPYSLSPAVGQSQRRCATGTQCTDQAAVLNVVTIKKFLY